MKFIDFTKLNYKGKIKRIEILNSFEKLSVEENYLEQLIKTSYNNLKFDTKEDL